MAPRRRKRYEKCCKKSKVGSKNIKWECVERENRNVERSREREGKTPAGEQAAMDKIWGWERNAPGFR